MQLTDVMATEVVSVAPATQLRDAARRMADADVGATMVLDDDGAVCGVITERDLLRCMSDGVDPCSPVSERMTRHVMTAPPTMGLPEAMASLVDGRFRHLPVIGDDSRVIGLVSMRDLMAYTALRLRGVAPVEGEDIDPAELMATIHRMRTGAN
jgi:CBS-domain-containing membrane protein